MSRAASDEQVELELEQELQDIDDVDAEVDDDEEYDYASDTSSYQYSSDEGAGDEGGGSKSKRSKTESSAKTAALKVNTNLGATAAQYQVISPTSLANQQNALIADVASVLSLPKPKASLLLRYFFWDKEKLMDRYCSDPEGVSQAAGALSTGQEEESKDVKRRCAICCEDETSQLVALGCKHFFCVDCWVPYLKIKIQEGPGCITTTCPQHGCSERVSDAIFQKLLPAADYARFQEYLLRSFVDINKTVKWCPAPGCDKAIASSGGLSTVSCVCGCLFCLRCGDEAHMPVSCEQLATWLEKCRNESETANWILANTKKCPKCAIRIEKNQGCNHMTCRSCKYEFCWTCMDVWSNHNANTGGYYKCNRYDPDTVPSDTDAARAKAELDRYLHYYQRFANHAEAGKFAARKREETDRRMAEFEAEANGSYMDVGFLNAAIDTMISCRRVLKFSYVYAYYLPQGKEKDLFEHLQEDLEKNTEHLTGLAEKPLDKVDRSDVINYTRVTENFLKNILGDVDNGLLSN
ncbi:hypothetical protein H310_04567 [Aphanomyces invadans]|uniref:RBR-type E3 ubiquitin transferase n=1 Tax=Aphanomyces invadans TaxID=157072 RepID=A0A024UDD2_9STRA|nr:hypothetical protein H310_04567 [Aphanomyces invadans]ETW04230.1 hypothetical protein H310_04567 [Aphanomyces invadans]|eukprot:XP_008867186.1 hypothetical protein H310_04567 [Aphanomyces invadans]